MIRRITPQIVSSYAKAFGVDTVLKTKPVQVYIPRAKTGVQDMLASWSSLEPHEYLFLPDNYKKKNFIYLYRLWSHEQGGGTAAIKRVVKESIEKGYEGRVALHAGMLDPDRGHPFFFYYKLGFRSTIGLLNSIAERILKRKNGAPRPNRFMLGTYFMYLPKQNVEHCLGYKAPATSLTYVPEVPYIHKSHKFSTKFADIYKKALGVRSILETKKPDFEPLKPKADVESWIIEKFSPLFGNSEKCPKEYINHPVTYIDSLNSFQQGSGTRAIKEIVRQSLHDRSEGRVALRACTIDFEKGSPIGFYYKLGFRSTSEKYNKICEEWLKKGGKMEDRPELIKYWLFAPQQMYLPKENIEYCLHYPEKILKLVN